MIWGGSPVSVAVATAAAVPASGGGTIHGTLSATLGPVTLAATGSLKLVGTLSATLGPVTLSATASLALTAQCAVQLGPVTLVSTATNPNGGATAAGGLGRKKTRRKIWYDLPNGMRVLATPDRYNLILRQLKEEEGKKPAEAVPAPAAAARAEETPAAPAATAPEPPSVAEPPALAPGIDISAAAARAALLRQLDEARRALAEEARIKAERENAARVAAEMLRQEAARRRFDAMKRDEEAVIMRLLLEAA